MKHTLTSKIILTAIEFVRVVIAIEMSIAAFRLGYAQAVATSPFSIATSIVFFTPVIKDKHKYLVYRYSLNDVFSYL